MDSRALVLSLITLAAAGCAVDEPTSGREDVAVATSAVRAAELDALLPWGDAPGALGARLPAEEFLGDGPSGVAIGPDGAVWLVDRLHQRLVRITATGVEPAFAVPHDAEGLAIATDGTVALWSALRSRVWLHDPSGARLAELVVPRLGGEVVGLSFGVSNQIVIETALQERFTVGGAHAPRTEAEFLRSKREGTHDVGGASLSVLRDDAGNAELVTSAPGKSGRLEATRRARIAEGARSVRLVGLSEGRALALVERLDQPGSEVRVTRELVVIDVGSGAVLGSTAVPLGAWSPRDALAVGGGQVAWITPEATGLRVVSRSIDAIVRGGVK